MTDRTRNERQKRRRENEKAWLKANGFTSWEALHTKLVSGKIFIIQPEPGTLGKTKPFVVLERPDHEPTDNPS
jgi:hypothetical protein